MRLRNWGLRGLVASWVVYWTVLVVVWLAPLAIRYWELERRSGHGTINLSFSADGLSMILLIVGPPLLMTVLWLATRPRRP